MDYLDEATDIWRRFVPPSGQADTVQGELLRAVEKLRDEAMRNGNGNWDVGFEILLSYLADHLLDPSVYPRATIAKTQAILATLRVNDQPVLEDQPYDELGDRVVDYFRHYGPLPHTRDPRLWR